MFPKRVQSQVSSDPNSRERQVARDGRRDDRDGLGVLGLLGVLADVGGEGSAPSPVNLLMSALAACTTMTVESYAQRKGWALERVTAEAVHLSDADGGGYEVRVRFEGDLNADQLERLEAIAGKCPVHRVMASASTVRVVVE
jgi:putative redox protein